MNTWIRLWQPCRCSVFLFGFALSTEFKFDFLWQKDFWWKCAVSAESSLESTFHGKRSLQLQISAILFKRRKSQKINSRINWKIICKQDPFPKMNFFGNYDEFMINLVKFGKKMVFQSAKFFKEQKNFHFWGMIQSECVNGACSAITSNFDFYQKKSNGAPFSWWLFFFGLRIFYLSITQWIGLEIVELVQKMVVINSALYICFGLAGSLVNVPLLIFVVIKSNLRNKYPTIAGNFEG